MSYHSFKDAYFHVHHSLISSACSLALSLSPDELYMTSISWVIPALMDHHGVSSSGPAGAPNINTCRPMYYQEDGAKVHMCSYICMYMYTHTHTVLLCVLAYLMQNSAKTAPVSADHVHVIVLVLSDLTLLFYNELTTTPYSVYLSWWRDVKTAFYIIFISCISEGACFVLPYG